jgi:cyclase
VKFESIRDAGDPAALAKFYSESGADELAMLGISAGNRAAFLDVIGKVAAVISVPLCVGGGIRSIDDMRDVIAAGANKVSVCGAALERETLLSEMASEFGSSRVVLAIDAKRMPASGNCLRWNAFSMGGKKDSGLDAVDWAKRAVRLGAGEILVTSIDADGTGVGYDLELCAAVSDAVTVPVTASGGAGSFEQIAEVFKKTNVAAALVASILHFGKTTIPEIKSYLSSIGINVNL